MLKPHEAFAAFLVVFLIAFAFTAAGGIHP